MGLKLVTKDTTELLRRFSYHPATTPNKIEAHENIRDLFAKVALEIENYLPDGREKAMVFTKIEEAMFWGNAGIARSREE